MLQNPSSIPMIQTILAMTKSSRAPTANKMMENTSNPTDSSITHTTIKPFHPSHAVITSKGMPAKKKGDKAGTQQSGKSQSSSSLVTGPPKTSIIDAAAEAAVAALKASDPGSSSTNPIQPPAITVTEVEDPKPTDDGGTLTTATGGEEAAKPTDEGSAQATALGV